MQAWRRWSQVLLAGEAAGVHRTPLAALQDDLTYRHAGVDGERPPGHVRHLQHLTARHPGSDEARGDVDHEPEAGESAAPLEPAGDVTREAKALARDGVDGFAGLQHV